MYVAESSCTQGATALASGIDESECALDESKERAQAVACTDSMDLSAHSSANTLLVLR